MFLFSIPAMSRRRFLRFMSVVGWVGANQMSYSQAAADNKEPSIGHIENHHHLKGQSHQFAENNVQCWDGLTPGNGYSLEAIEHLYAHLPFHFEIQQQFDRPVLNTASQVPGRCFEGGIVLKVGGLYRLFTCDFKRGNYCAPTTLPYWVSRNGTQWKFQSVIVGTIPPSRHNKGFTPAEPTPIFNPQENRWYLFFVAYNDQNSDGKIHMMVSANKGYRRGIIGLLLDLGVIMRPGPDSQSWEGPQGVDSFYPYQANGRWYAMYGSSTWSATNPHPYWLIGLASAPALKGPWKRCNGNPLKVEKIYWENPLVSRIGGWYVAVYDAVAPGAPTYIHNGGHIAGYTCSKDGIHWLPGGRILVQPDGPANWSSDLRTPLGLIPEGNGIYTMFYTGFTKGRGRIFLRNESVGMVRLRIIWH